MSSFGQTTRNSESDYDRGYRLWYYDKLDSAFLMFNRYVNDPDNIQHKGSAYKYMGDIQWKMSDLYGAQESLTSALHIFDPRNNKHHEELGVVYNLLGNVSYDLKLYDDAFVFFNKALPFVEGSYYMPEVMNGTATRLQKKGDYNAAIVIYDSMLYLKPADQSLVARIIDNRAKTKWLKNPDYNALPEFHHALKIRIDSQYIDGLNASYAHLSDYYTKSNTDSAFWYAKKLRQHAIENKNPDYILEAIDKMIRLTSSPKLKDEWYNEYKTLNDSLQFSRDTTRNRFALIRYDVQKSKADNLMLQQDIIQHQLFIFGIIAFAIFAIGLLWVRYNKRKKRIKQESDDAIKNANLKTSQKVHDVVANGLYGIMNELEHNPTIEKEPLIIKIEDLYEKSRNISYEDSTPADMEGYDRQIHNLLTAFDNAQTRIILVGNQPKFWSNIKPDHKQQLELVLKELMVNMKKHSQAKNVVIKFSQDNNAALINYKDDGVGIASDIKYGNGLQNTVSRINSIGGQVIFEKSDKPGVSIAISVPL